MLPELNMFSILDKSYIFNRPPKGNTGKDNVKRVYWNTHTHVYLSLYNIEIHYINIEALKINKLPAITLNLHITPLQFEL